MKWPRRASSRSARCSASNTSRAMRTLGAAAGSAALTLFNANLAGCWNWWGYGNDRQFLTKKGVQVSALWAMVQRVTGQR